ncbi:PCI domain-containing protein [Mycena kentingensis (nom. inval.)]|nr:PCI domain-containing protein [Mycena kentingensis (nom. inval.)]
MATTTFPSYLTQINDALIHENGPGLAYLLRPTSPPGKALLKNLRAPTAASLAHYKGSLAAPWDEIAIQYVLICTHIAHGRPVEAFKEHCQLVSLFLRFFTESKGWPLPALFTILRDLRDLADDADSHTPANATEENEHKISATHVMQKAFSCCMTDRTSPVEESRKWGVYYVASLIMKCYFKVKKISLTRNIIKALENNADIPDLGQYPRSHQVTYRYYIGMIAFLNEDFVKAEKELTLAFYNCLTAAPKNQTRILAYLVPLRILRGHLPSEDLLARFPALANLFVPFISAIRAGDLAAFDDALAARETKLIELNLLLTLEKARELCLRVVFRRVWLAHEKSTRIAIASFHAGLRLSSGPGAEVEVEEAECLVANMIYRGFIRGYISHEKQTVVLAATNAFPRVADRAAPFAMG